jgi:diguanylate cyclase (GGDEF)-like protein
MNISQMQNFFIKPIQSKTSTYAVIAIIFFFMALFLAWQQICLVAIAQHHLVNSLRIDRQIPQAKLLSQGFGLYPHYAQTLVWQLENNKLFWASSAASIIMFFVSSLFFLQSYLIQAKMIDKIDSLARTDSLTGIYNRRVWDEQLPLEIERSQRSNKPLSIVLIDIDRFKSFNDTRGHQAGDELLQKACQSWKQQLRRLDLLVRYGGEEFGLILPGCDVENGIKLIDRLRAHFPEEQTFSAGIGTWDTKESQEKLVERVDRALYQAKRTGRNRTVIADNLAIMKPVKDIFA